MLYWELTAYPLACEVKTRERLIYTGGGTPQKQAEVEKKKKKRQTKIAAVVTSSSGITRTPVQWRRWYNDVGRRGKK